MSSLAQLVVSMDPLSAKPPPQSLGKLPSSPPQGGSRPVSAGGACGRTGRAGMACGQGGGYALIRPGGRLLRPCAGGAAVGGSEVGACGTGSHRSTFSWAGRRSWPGSRRSSPGSEAGQPWLVAIEGDPGVGKTALARRCLAQASGLRVLSARGDQAEADLDYGIIDQLLRAADGVSQRVVPPEGTGSAVSSFAVGARLLEVVGEQQATGPGSGRSWSMTCSGPTASRWRP